MQGMNQITCVMCPGSAKASPITKVTTGSTRPPSAAPIRGANSMANTAAEDEQRNRSPQVLSSTPSCALVAGTIPA